MKWNMLEIVSLLGLPLVPAGYKYYGDLFLAVKPTYALAQLCSRFSLFSYNSVLFVRNIPEWLMLHISTLTFCQLLRIFNMFSTLTSFDRKFPCRPKFQCVFVLGASFTRDWRRYHSWRTCEWTPFCTWCEYRTSFGSFQKVSLC